MFKKKLLAVLSAALVTVMIPATALATTTEELEWGVNGGKSTVEGSSYGVEAIIEVELPGDLAFGINPLYLDADGDTTTTPNDNTQIVTGQYMITNYSNVDVLITAETTVEASTDATDIAFLQDNTTDAVTGELVSTNNKRNVYLVQMLPAAPATIDTNNGNKINVNAFNLASGGATEIGGLVLGSGSATALFKLDSYNYTTETLVPGNISGFTFAGAVDPNATYLEGDVTVKTVFTLNTLTANQSDNAYEGLDLNSVSYDATVVQTVSGVPTVSGN